jgi:hypothetical protein
MVKLVACNVLPGKDFVLFVKEIQTGDETYPDYKMSMFKQDTTTFLYLSKKRVFKTHQLLMVKLIQQQGKVKLSYLIENTNLKSLSPRN